MYDLIVSDGRHITHLEDLRLSQLLVQLDETPRGPSMVLNSLQWLVFMIANTVTVPIVLGHAFGFDAHATALFVTRTLFVSGLVSFFQALLGHRYAVMEGPAGMWWGVFMVLIQMAHATGQSMPDLERGIELGLIVAGALYVLLAVCGWIDALRKLFTPVVTGCFLVILGFQLAGSIVSGMFGIGWRGHQTVSVETTILSLILLTLTLSLMAWGRGIWKTIAVLLALGAGWLLYGVLGLLQMPSLHPVFALPQIFAFGPPIWHGGIIITALLTAFILLSNLIASVQLFAATIESEAEPWRFRRGTLVTGAGTAVTGLFSAVGLVPLTTSSSLVSLTGVASRLPFLTGAGILTVIGLFPSVGELAATLPSPAGYAVLFVVFGQLLGFGLKDFTRLRMDQRDLFVISIPLLAGVGVLFVPESAWRSLPAICSYILGNGLILGTILVLLLEHVVFRRKAASI